MIFSPPVYLGLLLSIFLFFTPSLSPSLIISTVVDSLEERLRTWHQNVGHLKSKSHFFKCCYEVIARKIKKTKKKHFFERSQASFNVMFSFVLSGWLIEARAPLNLGFWSLGRVSEGSRWHRRIAQDDNNLTILTTHTSSYTRTTSQRHNIAPHPPPHTACHHCISITRGSEDLFLIQSVSAGVTSPRSPAFSLPLPLPPPRSPLHPSLHSH